MNIDSEFVDEKIEQIADSEAMAEADVREIYEAKLSECEELGFEGAKAREKALTRVFTAFKRRQQSNAVKVEGIFLASGDRYDAVAYQRSNAIEAYEENPQKAIKEGEIAVACPPEEAEHLEGAGVSVVGKKSGWAIVAHPDNEKILKYNFAQRDPESGEVTESDDGDGSVEDGWRLYPLDTRETFSSGDENPNYGMPTDKHQWTRRGLGIFRSDITDGEVKIGHVTLRGDVSAEEPPLGDAVQFKARVDGSDDNDDEIYINGTDETEIEPNPELGEQIDKGPTELIKSYFGGTEYLHDLKSAYEYMHKQDGRRTIIVHADVYTMDLEPTSNGTLRFEIGQMEFTENGMQDIEATVWLPEWQKKYVDFAVDSHVFVVGRAQLRDAYDPETGETTSEEQEIVLNGQGIYADPDDVIPREEDTEDLGEDDFDFEAGDDSDDEADESEEEPDFDEGDW